MGQQEFDNFKQRIKEWMDTHPEEYDCFEEIMNRKDNAGYRKILSKAFSLVPKYRKLLRRKVNKGAYDDISDIETLFSENNLAETLVNSFEKNSRNFIIPAMLSWLYFGKSFERMVERGEEIRQNPNARYVDKLIITSTIKTLISKSISLGLRTKNDWEEHNEQMKIADSNDVVNWAITGTPLKKKKVGRKSEKPELPENLRSKIGDFLKTKNTQRDIACLKIALEEMYSLKSGGIKAFRDALQEQYGKNIHIISERGIQEAYKELTELMGSGMMAKDQKENRNYIDEIKTLLSDME